MPWSCSFFWNSFCPISVLEPRPDMPTLKFFIWIWCFHVLGHNHTHVSLSPSWCTLGILVITSHHFLHMKAPHMLLSTPFFFFSSVDLFEYQLLQHWPTRLSYVVLYSETDVHAGPGTPPDVTSILSIRGNLGELAYPFLRAHLKWTFSVKLLLTLLKSYILHCGKIYLI